MGKATIRVVLIIGLISVVGFFFSSARAQGLVLLEGHFNAPDDPGSGVLLRGLDAASTRLYQTSEYLIGQVAVDLILVESDGTIDPEQSTWTAAQRQNVIDEVRAGLDWWVARRPEAHLSFVVEDHVGTPVTIGYEPINHAQSAEGAWIGKVMTKLGYTAGNYFSRVRTYVNDLRARQGTDWAFTIFVVNSSGDADGAFSDGYFAYAYVGGPYLVMTYDNGGYGIVNMDAVLAHEVGHIFRALDQYSSANIPCTTTSGYLNIENQNSQRAGCTSNTSSIMRGGIAPFLSGSIDPLAAGQIGWRDSDADGLLDPIDTTPVLTVTTGVQSGTQWAYAGQARDLPYPSAARPALSINAVSIEYQLDHGDWLSIPSGAVDDVEGSLAFTLTLTNPTTGNHRLNLRARNSAGNTSMPATQMLIVPDPVDGGLDTRLMGSSPVTTRSRTEWLISGEATSFLAGGEKGPGIVAVEMQVDNGEWQLAQAVDGAFDSPDEGFTLKTRLTPGHHTVRARATDAAGKVEQRPAILELIIADQHHIYLPLVIR